MTPPIRTLDLSRRQFLTAASVAAGTALLAGCTPGSGAAAGTQTLQFWHLLSGGDGVKVLACENTMRNMKLERDDMHPAVSYVPAGVTEIMKKQAEGWSYLRP